MEKKFDYDLFVIGGGSGGVTAANRAAGLKKKVGIADFVKATPLGTTWGLGGTCLNVGCIPKKLMHYASLLGEAKKDQAACGWTVDEHAKHNWDTMLEKVNNHIRSQNFGIKSMFMQSEVDYHNALASFVDKHTILLKDKKGVEKKVTAENIVIAVGGRPNYLEVEGARELCVTSDDLFWMKKAPGNTLVIGAGYIALECGGFIKGMDHPVEVLYRSQILRGFDQDMVDRVVQNMTEMGINFTKGNATKFEKKGDKIVAHLALDQDDKVVNITKEYDTVLLAVSRHADTKNLNLEAAGVKAEKSGKIPVNEQWRTSTPHIFALGDVTTINKELTPVAIKEGLYIAHGLFGSGWKKIDYKTVATTVFTPLEYSLCGLNETEAIEKYGNDNVDVYHSNFAPLEWNYMESRPKDQCYIKVIVLLPEKTILGIHYVGPNAGEVMGGYSVAVRLGLKFDDLAETIGIHPTTSEEVVLLEVTKRESPNPAKKNC